MSKVQFQINPQHIAHFLANKAKGVCVEVTNTTTQESGWLFIGHTSYWRKYRYHLLDKVKWVVSCYLQEDELSPFEGGNSSSMVKTKYSGDIIEVTKIIKKEVDNFSGEDLFNRDITVLFPFFQPFEEPERCRWSLRSFYRGNRVETCSIYIGEEYYRLVKVDGICFKTNTEVYRQI
jgi:hypothetical protein